MAKKTKLSLEEYQQLMEADTFEELPFKVKKKLLKLNENIYLKAKIFEALNLYHWYIIDDTDRFLKIFSIEGIEPLDSEENIENKKIPIKIINLTPTYSNDIEEYPIYQVGIPLNDDGKVFISGKERKDLTPKQLKKWDYFFRASKKELTYRHVYLINEFELLRKRISKLIKGEIRWIIFLFIVMMLVWYFMKVIFVRLGIVAFFLYLLLPKIIHLYGYISNTLRLTNFSIKLEEEKEFLKNQILQNEMSPEKMEQWLKEELAMLDEQAVEDLDLPKHLITRLQWKDVEENKIYDRDKITGLLIDEWGYFQPLSLDGKNVLNRDYWHHLHALKFYHDRPLVGVYYITYIYLTEDGLAVSRFFYNYILARRFGQVTKKYYHKDIVSIGTTVKESEVFNDKAELETRQIEISFYNNEQILITLTDKVSIENLREKVDKKIENQENKLGLFENNATIQPSNTSELMQLLNMNDNLPGTRIGAIVKTLKQFWNEKKVNSLPLGGQITWHLDEL